MNRLASTSMGSTVFSQVRVKSWNSLKIVFAVMAVLSSNACATNRYGGLSNEDLFRTFASGEAVFEIGCIECAAVFAMNKVRLKQLNDNGQFETLAIEVMRIGHGEDLAWYYLGKAAEELGFSNSGMKYYLTSTQTIWQNSCKFTFNCSGIVLPDAAEAGISRILASKSKTFTTSSEAESNASFSQSIGQELP